MPKSHFPHGVRSTHVAEAGVKECLPLASVEQRPVSPLLHLPPGGRPWPLICDPDKGNQ